MMTSVIRASWRVLLPALLLALAAEAGERVHRQTATLRATKGPVLHVPDGQAERVAIVPSSMGSGDGLVTLRRAGAVGELADRSPFQLRPQTRVRFESSSNHIGIHLLAGEMYRPTLGATRPVTVITPHATLTPEGTEFLVCVDEASDETRVVMFEGTVEIRRGNDAIRVPRNEVGIAANGRPLRTQSVLTATNIVQWWIYYPAVLAPDDLALSGVTTTRLADSLNAYRRGDLRQALESYAPDLAAGPQDTVTLRIYHAALLLAVGEVQDAESELAATDPGNPLGAALGCLINAVRRPLGNAPVQSRTVLSPEATRTASEWLAASYQEQAGHRLEGALHCAREAVARSPRFGFAWARVAELEFSLGSGRSARRALEQAAQFCPDHGQVQALRGFVLAAANQTRAAFAAFEAAIALDPALANAWLGRGLCRIRSGDLEGGREDLRTAAILEPERAALRSYAGKAFGDSGDRRVAMKELGTAQALDPLDPTAWLYSGLINQQENRVNHAISDLEHSAALNDNRAVYRSRLLLDQDRAVRSANLANVYADAGMEAVSVREATRSLNSDYANASAHLFLANSYNALRDPRQVNLRHEAAWFSEFLLANLLAPVGAGTLSQNVSQGEYSKLFERDRLGVVSETLWTSNGDWLESGTQFGRSGNFEYALDALYRSEVGQRANNDLEQLTLSFAGKAQLGLADTVLLQGIYYDAESGDVAQHYDPAMANPGLRLHETHEPIVLAGWHHEWKPGAHTLLVVSPWNTHGTVTDPAYQSPIGWVKADGSIHLWNDPYPVEPQPLDYATRYTGVSAELQQLWQVQAHTLIGGLRYQAGEFDTEATLEVGPIYGGPGESIPRDYGASPGMERLSLYAYDQWQFLPWALLTAGVSYDRLTEPVNFTVPPLTNEAETLDQVSPKIGLTLTPWQGGTVRAGYTRSLGGVSLDQSYRLEPAQIAGFTQTYRGLMPESFVGLVPGQEIETWGVSFEQHFPTRTYLTVSAEQLHSDATRGVGAFLDVAGPGGIVPATLTQSLDFEERSLLATVNQLIGEHLALGAAYRISEAALDTAYAGVEDSPVHQRSLLQQLDLSARFNHPLGFFARWDSIWTDQSNTEDAAALAGDAFWQHNLWVGWRFHRRHAEVAVGVLNLTDEDYRLHPLNYYQETYRERTVAVSARFNF
jgi:tetratricopeptide (TPR) repeat protein